LASGSGAEQMCQSFARKLADNTRRSRQAGMQANHRIICARRIISNDSEYGRINSSN
jgi:hypothetical protein